MSTSDSTLPSNTRAILMTSMDTSVDRIDVIARMLTARGYKVDGASMASNNMDVNTLRELGGAVNGTSVDQSGNEIGVLYIMSHGKVPSMGEQLMNALGTPLPPFVLLTSQAPSPNDSQDLALQSDLNANPPRVVLEPKNDLFTRGASGKVVIAGTGDRYGVTTDFFRFYWRGKIFADDSLVFVNACGSAAADFQQVLAGCGAGLVLGWTGITAEEAEAATADFVFDRFLGTNNSDPAFFPEVLPQRPFDWTFVQGRSGQPQRADGALTRYGRRSARGEQLPFSQLDHDGLRRRPEVLPCPEHHGAGPRIRGPEASFRERRVRQRPESRRGDGHGDHA